MYIKNILRSKKYLSRIYLLVATAMFFIVTIFSFFVYRNAELTVLQNQYESAEKVLYQVKYNINLMDEMVKNLCLTTYFNNDIKAIMSYNKEEMYDIISKINNLKTSVVDTNSFVHSIYIYNKNNKIYYSTYKNLYYNDTMLAKVIQSYGKIPKMKLIPRKIENNDSGNDKKYENVFSYFLYNSIDQNNQMDEALVINVKSEWLFNNIEMINMIDKQKQDKIYILSDKNEFIENGQGDSKFNKALKQLYSNHITGTPMNSNEKIGFFSDNINGKKYLISYISVEKEGWVLLKTQLYEEVYQYIQKLKISIIFITIIFLALTLIISMSISKSIYKPFDKLLKKVSSSGLKRIDIDNSKDEMSYLQEVYSHSIGQLNVYKKEKDSNREIMRNYFLRKLLFESYSINDEEFAKVKEENSISLTLDNHLALCVIKIDNFKEFEEKFDDQDRELYKFAIINIATEIISSAFKNEALDLKNEQIVLILNVCKDNENFCNRLTMLIRQVQEYILNYFKISLSVSISEIIEDVKELAKLYKSTLDNSMYRYIYGKMSVITHQMVKKNDRNSFGYSSVIEKKLIEEIKCGNIQSEEDVVLVILSEISKVNYNNIILSIMHLINTIKNVLDEMNQVKLEPVHIDFNLLNKEILELETIDEAYVKIMKLLRQMMGEEKNPVYEKHSILVEAIKDIIQVNYFDSELCVSKIASILKVSSTHIGKTFNGSMHMSITEYINEVRLKKAVEWLEKSKLSAYEIMVKVGIENESYFYKLFKKKYGTTPREYALQKVLKQS